MMSNCLLFTDRSKDNPLIHGKIDNLIDFSIQCGALLSVMVRGTSSSFVLFTFEILVNRFGEPLHYHFIFTKNI